METYVKISYKLDFEKPNLNLYHDRPSIVLDFKSRKIQNKSMYHGKPSVVWFQILKNPK
jgi:hypothetical protein